MKEVRIEAQEQFPFIKKEYEDQTINNKFLNT